jgi:hypothetical protein
MPPHEKGSPLVDARAVPPPTSIDAHQGNPDYTVGACGPVVVSRCVPVLGEFQERPGSGVSVMNDR